jgi:hypothetical protein
MAAIKVTGNSPTADLIAGVALPFDGAGRKFGNFGENRSGASEKANAVRVIIEAKSSIV